PRFCTALFGILTPAAGGCAVELASGGHPPALLLRADGSAAYQPTPGGQLVGMLPNARVATTRVSLSPGDTLLLYSDGLTEARVDTERNRLGEQGLLDFAATRAPTTAPALIAHVTALLTTLTVDDDVAALALSV
ncbi:MAG: serine/threonine-protein phosphatase, partial [Pseudonocardiaceae bacterium]|nr:serine/threonine-protein phosphatase [Pseudonocardiaceae bacterium]